jgi:hypothetical protein
VPVPLLLALLADTKLLVAAEVATLLLLAPLADTKLLVAAESEPVAVGQHEARGHRCQG